MINEDALYTLLGELSDQAKGDIANVGDDSHQPDDFRVMYRGHSICTWMRELRTALIHEMMSDSDLNEIAIIAAITKQVPVMRTIGEHIEHNYAHVMFEFGRIYEREMK